MLDIMFKLHLHGLHKMLPHTVWASSGVPIPDTKLGGKMKLDIFKAILMIILGHGKKLNCDLFFSVNNVDFTNHK